MLKVVKASFLCGYVKTSWLHRADVSIKTIPLLFSNTRAVPTAATHKLSHFKGLIPLSPYKSKPLPTPGNTRCTVWTRIGVQLNPWRSQGTNPRSPESSMFWHLFWGRHKPSHILSVRLCFSAQCFLKSRLLTISNKVGHFQMCSQVLFVPKSGLNPKTSKSPSLGEALPVLVAVTRPVAAMRSSAWKRLGAGCIAPDYPNWKPEAPD